MSQTSTKKLVLFFPRYNCEEPIIYRLVKDHNLIVNVYRARVTPEEEGYLVLDVTGAEQDIGKAMEFLRTCNVVVNHSGKGVTWDEHRCTHCGQCITHCPTDALHIADPVTRKMAFTEDACIECLACIRVCPFGACASAF
jgi:ferredoxin